ncbi:MAG: calcium/sodium antiporter [Alphaproteobacteria bacterium]|nr:calcium/sodium antiporter [Alphaproteobacteria bacterium]
MDIILILSGLVALFFGGEWLVRGSVGVAKRLGVSTLLVSLVVVGFGTSAPELLVCIKAALSGAQDLALGNVIGSNIANILLILGLAAVIRPISCGQASIRRDAVAVLCASLVLAFLSFFHEISRISGALMLGLLFAYMYVAYRQDKKSSVAEKAQGQELQEHIEEEVHVAGDSTTKSVLLVLLGLGLLVLGADWLVNGATSIARAFGISEAVIGLTLVALGTSLPELATAFIASLKGHSDVVIGNVLGSNLFNILGILGVTALIAPLALSGRIVEFDLWLMLGTAVLLYPLIRSGHRITRIEGGFCLFLYAGYIGMMFIT